MNENSGENHQIKNGGRKIDHCNIFSFLLFVIMSAGCNPQANDYGFSTSLTKWKRSVISHILVCIWT
jgi:hypothetical protein